MGKMNFITTRWGKIEGNKVAQKIDERERNKERGIIMNKLSYRMDCPKFHLINIIIIK
jgi:hypothetical protein